jgi:hypothetical protein
MTKTGQVIYFTMQGDMQRQLIFMGQSGIAYVLHPQLNMRIKILHLEFALHTLTTGKTHTLFRMFFQPLQYSAYKQWISLLDTFPGLSPDYEDAAQLQSHNAL